MSLTLSEYLSRTRRLLQNPSAPTALYSDADLSSYINQGRLRVAAEGESIRYLGTIPTVADQRNYNINDIVLGVSADNGIAGALKVNSVTYGVGTGGFLWVAPQAWPFFQTYMMSKAVPDTGAPKDWSQFGQGSTGNFYIDPIPDIVYSLTCDCVCYPNDLDGTDDEIDAVPKLWDEAVPYFAAYLALLAAQTQQRQADADRMLTRYKFFSDSAREFSNPMPSNYLYSQSKDPTRSGKLSGGSAPIQGGR